MKAGARDARMSINERVEALREEMRRAELTAYVVPSTDPHQSEYTPAYWHRRQWISGFTGSVADVVVTLDKACLWTDSRYFLQAEEQLEGTPYVLQRMGVPGVLSLKEWLTQNLGSGAVVGIDPQLVTLNGQDDLQGALSASGATLKLVPLNLVDKIWAKDRPSPPSALIRLHPTQYAGETRAKKIARLRGQMAAMDATAHVLTRLDAIAWLFNIRGGDVDFTPVAVAYALVTRDEAMLFTDMDKVSHATLRALQPQVSVRPYESVVDELKKLGQAKVRVWVDPTAATAWIGRALRGATLLRRPCQVTPTKARKNKVEIAGARAAHERDGVALVRFFYWLRDAVTRERVTELSAAAELEGFRKELELYQGPSFNTISAYGSHGAIVHYGPTEETDRRLKPQGIFLLDSGGQFLDGTTDVTRTVLLGGEATAEQRDHFTRVLKGHITLATTKFPQGVSGQRLDALARWSLWQAGLEYGHGTGHGVGSFLGVHESPPGVAPARFHEVPLAEGHILSNEPGYYRTGRYGIRTENLMVVVQDREL
jgi:Xaa-Pro aminopeptidase